uniref:APC membrane recruitment protein 1 n=1 Tax=Nothoprocta perdicaria TaxID=30464 RepID=A0A8C6Z823_NOTPE
MLSKSESWSRIPCTRRAELPPAPPGKLKKTAFKLFGGKRSICTLPSFFGGRNKGQGKGASKKGLSKSKTHDGISGAAYEESSRVQLESPVSGSRDSHLCPLPSSQSAHVAIDSSVKVDFSRQDNSPPGSIEGCEKKTNGDKSLSFSRPKKGLKGFLNSIRRHRKSKAAECEKTELPGWGGDSEEAKKTQGMGAETQQVPEEGALRSAPLAWCGDIIAEPDILSIAESTMSVERSRDTAKRSSCLVTYQGGGEEMAMPEEAEEYLQQVWDSTAEGDRSYDAQLPPTVSSQEPPVVSSKLDTHGLCEVEAHPYAVGGMDDMELLTPQSDQQESAPNSDEGYYDSTTPGPDDEAGDGLSEIKKDRLPRDSYSGDALYEFYEPDDTLMSPCQAEESLYESKVSRPEIFNYFLDFCLPIHRLTLRHFFFFSFFFIPFQCESPLLSTVRSAECANSAQSRYC